MSLSPKERRDLDRIARFLNADDPVLADRLTQTATPPAASRPDPEPDAEGGASRRRERLAWLTMWVGAELLFVGLVSARGLISGGTIVGCYGLVILIMGCVPAVRAQARRRGWRAGCLGGREESPSGGKGLPDR